MIREWFENLSSEQKYRVNVILERMEWNMSRLDARHVLSDLDKQITETGGERQRGEGRKLIARIQARLKPWVD